MTTKNRAAKPKVLATDIYAGGQGNGIWLNEVISIKYMLEKRYDSRPAKRFVFEISRIEGTQRPKGSRKERMPGFVIKLDEPRNDASVRFRGQEDAEMGLDGEWVKVQDLRVEKFAGRGRYAEIYSSGDQPLEQLGKILSMLVYDVTADLAHAKMSDGVKHLQTLRVLTALHLLVEQELEKPTKSIDKRHALEAIKRS